MRAGLNLARNPFLNSRPIGRLAVLLWILGGALLVFNVILYWGYFTSSEDRRGDLTGTQQQIAKTESAIAGLRSELGDLQLPRQNAQVAFLNRKIAERTFGWSRLFDDLEEVLPHGVRLVSLSPRTPEDDGPSRDPRDRVQLGIDCIARDGDSQLEFIDSLFTDPDFGNPRLAGDSTDEAGVMRFNLSVIYYPKTAATVTPTETERQEEAEDAEGAESSGDESSPDAEEDDDEEEEET